VNTADPLSTHGVTMDFGKHSGELLTRVPVSYVRWMANNVGLPERWRLLAKAEFERRGDTMPAVELTGHAIDNASLRALPLWRRTGARGEGLYSWLMRMVLEAREKGEKDGERIKYQGLILVVVEGHEFPVLKTVMT